MEKRELLTEITRLTRAAMERPGTTARWGTPLMGVADADDPGFLQLKELVGPWHMLPEDGVAGAKSVISYYLPFTKALAETNRGKGLASPEWARTYEETNALLGEIGESLCALLERAGYRAAVPVAALTFDRERAMSGWSQRHVARLAGLGSFGLNNMLITGAGCCGRYGSIVTDAIFPPDPMAEETYCLYKKNGSCGKCADACPAGALKRSGFDRFACFARCRENGKTYRDLGGSYGNADTGSEVCGKCVAGMPCAFLAPGKEKKGE